jgi:putative aldouronate transport system permease protein
MASRIFDALNGAFLALLALVCLMPMVHVLALSLSDSVPANTNAVLFLPKGANLEAYRMVFGNPKFLRAFGVSVFRTSVGTGVNLLLTVLAAYPLSKEARQLRGRTLIVAYFLIPMMVSGGLIPMFILISKIGLMDSIWVLILPGACNVGYVIMMMNFFRGINKSLLESAVIDGANEFVILFRIVLPMSMASVATIALFCVVAHWNEWFGGTIYLNTRDLWPLQTLLKTMMVQLDLTGMRPDEIARIKLLSDRSFRAAQVMFATVPILFVYPFAQKYFIKGVTVGSVKE